MADETYAALIQGDEVANTIVVDPNDQDFLAELRKQHDAVEVVGDRDRPSPGWKWDGSEWEPPAAVPAPDPEDEVVSPEEAAAKGLVARAKAALRNEAAPDPERQQAATFLRSMGEL